MIPRPLTREDYEQEGKDIISKLKGKNWKLEIQEWYNQPQDFFDNKKPDVVGWGYNVSNGFISVSKGYEELETGTKEGYIAIINSDFQAFDTDPNVAVSKVLREFTKQNTMLNEKLAEAKENLAETK